MQNLGPNMEGLGENIKALFSMFEEGQSFHQARAAALILSLIVVHFVEICKLNNLL